MCFALLLKSYMITIMKKYKNILQLSINNVYGRLYSSKDVRNVAILAHIDAGKTTTTERMLYYSNKIRSLGEVHRGNTITDYLRQERERGITICSSAVTFQWNDVKINLLDTPGHVDFTMEVEQCLQAVDGVIIVLDGTAGVEAQTITVWSQADRHQLPKISFINKMDRVDSNFEKCLYELSSNLNSKPLCLQYPCMDNKGNLSLFDVISLEHVTWNSKNLGRAFTSAPIRDEIMLNDMKSKRFHLIDTLSGFDDELAEFIINNEGFDQVTDGLIQSALRRATCQQKIVPVFLGSAYKNIGVQKLMDGIIQYLPAPHERNQIFDSFKGDFAARVFKIVHDKQRGPLSLIRIFRGELKKNMRLMTAKGHAEVVSRIYEPLADEYKEIAVVEQGDVAICSGLKHAVSGDLLIINRNSLANAKKHLNKLFNEVYIVNNNVEHINHNNNNDGNKDVGLIEEIFCLEPQVPDAVYFCSIEPPTAALQNTLDLALKQLQREDPSLKVTYDNVTGQTVLGGMGSLHLDIVRSRILSEYNIHVDLGPLQIAYKETLQNPSKGTLNLEKDILGNKQSVSITVELVKDNKDIFSLDKSPENAQNLQSLKARTIQIIRKGCLAALERGPRVGGQVVNTQIKLHNVHIGRGTADSFLMSTAGHCVQKILSDNGTRLLEPIMLLEIITPNECVPTIMADLARRRATIEKILPKGEKNKLIIGKAPLAELEGYSDILRTVSSGTANMTMQPSDFAFMLPKDEEIAIRRAQGLE